ncbi:MAG: hypothetical protein RLZZ470_207, partial [Pseudomonadota bacterium]
QSFTSRGDESRPVVHVPQEGLHLRFGHHLEPFVAQEYERVTGHATHVYPQTIHHQMHQHLFAHVDRLVSTEGGPVIDDAGRILTNTLLECKTASAFTASQWGPSWGDQVPSAYLAQCLWYTTITGCSFAHLAVLLGNSDFRIYRIKHDHALGERLVQAALIFWDEHVMTGKPPEPSSRAEALLIHPTEVKGLEVRAGEDTLSKLRRLHRINKLSKRLDREVEHIKAELVLQMREAERITHLGTTLATWRTVTAARRVDLERMRQEVPDVVARYTVDSQPTRRLLLGSVGHA